MGKFLESERVRQANFKRDSFYFSNATRAEGVYAGKPRPFCIPLEHAEENLMPKIRKTATDFFDKHKIKWHQGQNSKPSNHLCDSQVCCVNFLFPFADQPKALETLFRQVYPSLEEMLPIEDDSYVSFEWIGEDDYLGEKKGHRSTNRTRGANCTSADAAVKFRHKDGQKQIVLIEWKYTESYNTVSLKKSAGGRDRTTIYQRLYGEEDCPLNINLIPYFDTLFYEPFYQLMRQQFLAHEMEKAHELGADITSVLHISPRHNTDFLRVTSPALQSLGDTATGVWKNLVKQPDRFISVNAEELFEKLNIDQDPETKLWREYIQARYTWILE